MADASYNAAVYMEQGGAKLVVASTGEIQNEGTITNSGAGKIVDSVEVHTVGSTAETVLLPYGMSVVGSSTDATTYILPVPTVAGVRKTISASSQANASTVISTSAGSLIGHTYNTITLSAAKGSIDLIGIPSSTGGAPALLWHVTGQSTASAVLTAV